jgi:hypothetical protein
MLNIGEKEAKESTPTVLMPLQICCPYASLVLPYTPSVMFFVYIGEK